MFWTEEPYIPPCCSQKYFFKLFSVLERQQCVSIYPNSDYSLPLMLDRVLTTCHICDLTIVLTERMEEDTRRTLAAWLEKTYWVYSTDAEGKAVGKKEPWVRSLTLVVPVGMGEGISLPRTTMHEARFTSPMVMAVSDRSRSIAIVGYIAQHTDMTVQTPGILCCTSDKAQLDEYRRLVNMNIRKSKLLKKQ